MATRPSRPKATRLHQNQTLGNYMTEKMGMTGTDRRSAKNTENQTQLTAQTDKIVKPTELSTDPNNDDNNKNCSAHCTKNAADSVTKIKNSARQNPLPEKYVKTVKEKRSRNEDKEIKTVLDSKTNSHLRIYDKINHEDSLRKIEEDKIECSKIVRGDANPQAKFTKQKFESEKRSWQKVNTKQQSKKPVATAAVSKFSEDIKRTTKVLQVKEKESLKEMIVVPKATRIQNKIVPRKSSNREATVMAINMRGRDDKNGSVLERRRHIMHNVINKYTPTLVLFQDFSLPDITSRFWIKAPLPNNYIFIGNETASIMYDQASMNVQDIPISEFQNTLEGLHRHSNNKLKRIVPPDFDPFPRMCTRIVTIKQEKLQFICVSWNGKFNSEHSVRMKHTQRLQYFEFLMEFLRIIKEKVKLPILIAGNFKVDMYSIEHLVKPPFHLCIYDASMRRTVPGIVDFFIITDELSLNDITWVSLREDTTAYQPNGVMDHDPVRALISGKVGKGGASKGMTNPNKWNSPKTKVKK